MTKPRLQKISERIAIEPVSRRMFLIGTGGLLAIPFLESLVPRQALAATANPRRLVFIHTPNQLPHPLYFPSSFGGQAVPSDLASALAVKSDGVYPYRELDLAETIARRGQISPYFNTSFNAYANRLSLYRGVDCPGRIDHGPAAAFGNMAGSHMGTAYQITPMRTIDEFLANSTNFYSTGKASYRFPVMRLGEEAVSTDLVDPMRPQLGYGLAGNIAALTLNGNLALIFDAMFASSANAADKVGVVDQIASVLGQSKITRRIGAADTRRLDDYLTSLGELRQSLTSPTANPLIPKPSITVTTRAPKSIANDADIANAFGDYYRDLAKLAVIAIKSGATKIITVGVDSSIRSTGVGTSHYGVNDWHANIAHTNDNVELAAVNRAVAETVFYKIVEGLDTVESGSQTYLDSTLVWMTSELSFGHSGVGMGGVMAGNTLGGLVHGKAYDFGDYDRAKATITGNIGEIAPGQPINRLWVGILKSLGLEPSDYLNKFGNGSSTFGYWRNDYPSLYEANFGAFRRDARIGDSLKGLFTK